MIGDLTLFDQLVPDPARSFIIAALLAVSAGSARAHLMLYENVEVYLRDPATIRIEFSIHAPELPSAVADGVDPAGVDATWLAGLPDETIVRLTQEAETFLRKTFVLRQGESDPLAGAEVRFDSLEGIRKPPVETKLPPGCVLAAVTLPNPGNAAPFSVGFAADAQKRLMLSVARPGAFPEVHDLAPGESVTIPLPEPPRPIAEEKPAATASAQTPVANSGPTLTVILIATTFAAVAWLAVRRRNAKESE